MPTFKEIDYPAEVVWMGAVPAASGEIVAEPQQQLTLGYDGVSGERHEGVLRPSCVRVKNVYPVGTEIRNVRQLSVLSQEELDLIAADMGLEALDPAYLGASIIVKGIPDFTFVPPSSRLQGPDGVTLTLDMENAPCVLPGRAVEKDHTGYGAKFKPAAQGRRGVTAWVERPGVLNVGDRLRLFVPDQRAWAP